MRPDGFDARLGMLAAAATVGVAVAFPAAAFAQDNTVTFTRHVAPILQENCQVCHRPGEIGPMSLMNYSEVRPWGRSIRQKVANREMPPYQYDLDVGIQALQYDPRLSVEEIATLVAWIDGGMVEGDPADMPPPVEWPPRGEWRLAEEYGQPDVIVPAKPYTVPAEGSDLWWEPLVEIPLEEDRYIKAIEVKPSAQGRHVVHHANTSLYLRNANGELEQQGRGRFTEYASGKLGEIVPEGAGRLLPANSLVRWSIHYYPMGEVVENEVTELAFWFHPKGYEPNYLQDLGRYNLVGDLAIPPHGSQILQGFHTFDHPVRIDSFQPHGHLRLRGASLEIFHPSTGDRDVVSMISDWTTWWQHSHLFDEDVAPLMPAGSVMILTHWYDNSADNPNNPDPEQWVYRGGRTTDEMSHAWIAVTHLDEAGYQQIKAEREAKQAETLAGGDGGGQ